MAAAAASAHPFGRGVGSSECCHNSSNKTLRYPTGRLAADRGLPWRVLVVAGGQDATVTTTSPSTTSEGTPAVKCFCCCCCCCCSTAPRVV